MGSGCLLNRGEAKLHLTSPASKGTILATHSHLFARPLQRSRLNPLRHQSFRRHPGGLTLSVVASLVNHFLRNFSLSLHSHPQWGRAMLTLQCDPFKGSDDFFFVVATLNCQTVPRGLLSVAEGPVYSPHGD